MKRVSLKIHSNARPHEHHPAYLLVADVDRGQIISFFSTRKYAEDEPLEISATIKGNTRTFEVQMRACHEQISSGRIMTGIPIPEDPLPNLTFYRCYARILKEKVLEVPAEVSADDSGPKAVSEPGAPHLSEVPPIDIAAMEVSVAASEASVAEPEQKAA